MFSKEQAGFVGKTLMVGWQLVSSSILAHEVGEN